MHILTTYSRLGELSDIGEEQSSVRQEVENPCTVENAETLEDEAANFASPALLIHQDVSLSVDLWIARLLLSSDPVTFVNCDHEGLCWFLDLVAIAGKSAGIEVINLGNGGKSNKLDNNINGDVDN